MADKGQVCQIDLASPNVLYILLCVFKHDFTNISITIHDQKLAACQLAWGKTSLKKQTLTCSNHPLNADVWHIDLLGEISDRLVRVFIRVRVDVGPTAWQVDCENQIEKQNHTSTEKKKRSHSTSVHMEGFFFSCLPRCCFLSFFFFF